MVLQTCEIVMTTKELTSALNAANEKLNDLMLAADPKDWHYNAFESDEAWKAAWDEAYSEVYALEEALSALDSTSE